MKGVVTKNGITYRRFKVKDASGKWKDHYVRLPNPDDPNFSAALARVNGKTAPRPKPVQGSFAALIAAYRPILAKREMADATRRDWNYYLGLIDDEHGHKQVACLERADCYDIRDSMIEEPGKSNSYMAKFKALVEFASERGWIRDNVARGIPLLDLGEYQPWPQHVLREVLDAATPIQRLAVISGLCSGQRISDCILMQHGWHDTRLMTLRSQKTDTPAVIPMHQIWLDEIAAVPRKAVTLLYDRFGKPFKDTDRLQAQLRRLMRKLGHVDAKGLPLYTFHGLGKNAICYLTEMGLTEETIGAIVGKTPETVRYYAKDTRRWMLAEAAAETVIAGRIGKLIGGESGR